MKKLLVIFIGLLCLFPAEGKVSPRKGNSKQPKQVEEHLSQAKSYYKAKQYGQAVSEYDKAIKLEKKNHKLYFLRAGAKYQKSDYKGAEKDFTAAIKLNSQNGDYYLMRGITRSVLNPPDKKGACADLDEAKKLGKDTQAMGSGVDEWCKESK